MHILCKRVVVVVCVLGLTAAVLNFYKAPRHKKQSTALSALHFTMSHVSRMVLVLIKWPE